MLLFIFGLFFGCMFLEPIVINFVYMSNPGLFLDIILTDKNRKKLEEEFLFDKRWENCE